MPENLPDDLGFELTFVDDQSYRFTLEQDQTLNEIFAKLQKHKLQVVSMRAESNRLEQYIMRLLEEQRS